MTKNKVIKIFGQEFNFYFHTGTLIPVPVFELMIISEPYGGTTLILLTILGISIGVDLI